MSPAISGHCADDATAVAAQLLPTAKRDAAASQGGLSPAERASAQDPATPPFTETHAAKEKRE